MKGGMFTWVLDLSGSVQWVYVTAPSDWLVTPWTAVRTSCGIGVQQNGAEIPLLKKILETKVSRTEH
jgi:hypothetical protein